MAVVETNLSASVPHPPPPLSLPQFLKAKRHLQHAANYVSREADSFRIVNQKLHEVQREQAEQFGKKPNWHRCQKCLRYNQEGSNRPANRREKAWAKGQAITLRVKPDAAPPDNLLVNLEARHYEYTTPIFLYHTIWLWGRTCCGVFGDGENGAYEWFIWDDEWLETSDCGYGSMSVALQDVLKKLERIAA